MTDPIQPATDEEVERIVTKLSIGDVVRPYETRTLIARIDAERAARERAEAACAEMRAGIAHVVQHQATHRIPMPMAYIDAVLSRTDLGRGWANPEMVARCRDAVADGFSLSSMGDAAMDRLVADLDELLDTKDTP